MRRPARRPFIMIITTATVVLTACGTGTRPNGTSTVAVHAAALSASSGSAASSRVRVRLLAFNDFHGHLATQGLSISASDGTSHGPGWVPAGGAAYLAAKIRSLKRHHPNSLVVSAGDMVGASPMISGYFHDEDTVEAMNRIVDVGSVGNHEFDEGSAEFRRLVHGGCAGATTCKGGHRYRGVGFDLLAANVLVKATGQPLLPPTVLRTVGGARIGFVGVTTIDTPKLLIPSGVADLSFVDPAATIQKYAPRLRAAGADAVIAVVHEGAAQNGGDITRHSGINDCRNVAGPIVDITRAVAPQVDAVISGHTHQAYNCRVRGVPLTQAATYGRLVTTIDLTVDTVAHTVTGAVARNRVVGHGRRPDAAVAKIVAHYRRIVKPISSKVVGRLKHAATRSASRSGESRLGDLIADAQLAATRRPAAGGAQVAIVQRGVLRGDLPKGAVTADDVFTAQPFGVHLVTKTYTGRQLDAALEGSFCDPAATTVDQHVPLNVSSTFRYRYDPTKPCGRRIRMRDTLLDGSAITPNGRYRVAMNVYLSMGGDGITGFSVGSDATTGVTDQVALTRYLTAHRGLTPPHRVRVRPL